MQHPPTIFSILLILSHLTFSTATDFPPCNAADEAVLLKIRDHFGGPNGRLDDWTNTSSCCSDWSFVGCGMDPHHHNYGRITTVTFSRSWGLSGTIPSEFGNLPCLDFFILADNINVTGEIPKSFSKLKYLKNLELDSNTLTGSIPEELFRIKRLEKVDLSGNRFSGEIPASVSSLLKLSEFNVSHNQLTGSLPKLPRSLKSVDVSYNQLCGRVPSGLNQFGVNSFEHNKCLCGSPLPTACK